MYDLLIRLKYQVKDMKGRHFRRWNITGMILLIVYAGVSIYNLCASSPSYDMWVINIIIMGKIIVRNKVEVKELRELYEETKCQPGYDFIGWHSNKLVMEMTSAVFSMIILGAGAICEFHFGTADMLFRFLFFIVGVITILLTVGEELLIIIENMYSAQRPVVIDEQNA